MVLRVDGLFSLMGCGKIEIGGLSLGIRKRFS